MILNITLDACHCKLDQTHRMYRTSQVAEGEESTSISASAGDARDVIPSLGGEDPLE